MGSGEKTDHADSASVSTDLLGRKAVEYAKSDTIDALTADQLDLMARSEHDLLVFYLGERTVLDVHRIRLLLDLGKIEAKRRLDALRSNARSEPTARLFAQVGSTDGLCGSGDE